MINCGLFCQMSIHYFDKYSFFRVRDHDCLYGRCDDDGYVGDSDHARLYCLGFRGVILRANYHYDFRTRISHFQTRNRKRLTHPN